MTTQWRADLNPELLAKLKAVPRKERIWNCWTLNYERSRDGYCIHMFEEGVTPVGRALCGARIAETGGLNLTEEDPSCRNCRRILFNEGLIESIPFPPEARPKERR